MVAALIVLLVVMGIWAIAWSMDSYASAQQAQATIEAAQAAQAAHLTAVLMLVLLILVFVAAVIGVTLFYLRWRRKKLAEEEEQAGLMVRTAVPSRGASAQLPGTSTSDLVQLMTLKILSDFMNKQDQPRIDPPRDDNGSGFW